MELFYNSKIDKNTTNFTISDEDFKHITRVMRKRKGDLIKFTNGKGYGFESQIERIEKKKIHFEIKKLFKTAHSNNLHIGICLLKSPTRFEFFLEKATEIGIKEITPLVSKNTLKKGINILRSKNKIISAMKQSLKYYMPKLNELELFETFCNNSDEKYKFISTCQDIKKIPVSNLTKIQESTVVLIGPEGDFNKDEVDYAVKNDFEPLSLGNNRLRSETAAIVVSSAFSTFK